MKRIYFFQMIMALGLTVAGCAETYVEDGPAPEMPVVSFPDMDADMEVMVDSPVHFEAVIESEGPVECSWSISGEKVASTPAMTYVFREVGEYQLVFEAFNSVGEVSEEFTVKATGVPLDVEFSVQEEVIGISVGDKVSITATAVAGDKEVSHQWKVSDEIVSETNVFEYTFNTAGTYTVSYSGINSDDMAVSKNWTVNVADLPLQIDFSIVDQDVQVVAGTEFTIETEVIHGAEGLVHSWSIDGAQVSSQPVFTHVFDAEGTYVVSYRAENSKGETVEKSWTITVTGQLAGYMYNDFETGTQVPSNYKGNDEALSIVENPFKTASNPSSQVLKNKVNGEHSTSGYININTIEFPDKADYGAVRVKIYIGVSPYYPRLQITVGGANGNKLPSEINGVSFVGGDEAKWKSLVKTDDWNEFVYDLEDCGYGVSNFSTITDIQFRPLSKFNGNNIDAGPVTDTNTRTVYYDDIEFLRK